MSKQCLSIEQMKHLQELGLDTSKASMQYIENNNGIQMCIPTEIARYIKDLEKGYIICDAFTLQDILDILPQEIIYLSSSYSLFIEYQEMRIAYCYVDREGIQWVEPTFGIGETIIDAAYKMLCWCIEKGYVETNK